MKNHGLSILLILCGLGLAPQYVAAPIEKIPALANVSTNLTDDEQKAFRQRKVELEATFNEFKTASDQFNSKPAKEQSDEEYAALETQRAQYIAAVKAFNSEMASRVKAVAPAALPYLYALQSRTLTPMADGGHPIDAPGSPPVGLRGLVGGTIWTFGFLRPHVKCEKKCQDDMKRSLDSQLALFCSSQSDPNRCLTNGLPFTPDMYDLVISMGSSHTAIEDLATRVLFDGATFGEFSRQNKEIFASLKGRQFATLDCHSNGAMVCLAALRSGDTTAKEVRLFGPQMNPEAAKRWQEYAANTNTTINIYINSGDPIPALSWKQPTPQTLVGTAATAVWITNPITGPATFAGALFHTYLDSRTGVMDTTLRSYGFHVTRSKCADLPSIDCHSMKRYETETHKSNANSIP